MRQASGFRLRELREAGCPAHTVIGSSFSPDRIWYAGRRVLNCNSAILCRPVYFKASRLSAQAPPESELDHGPRPEAIPPVHLLEKGGPILRPIH